MQVRFVDRMSTLGFSEVMESLGDEKPEGCPETYETMTTEATKHRHEFATFQQARLIEIAGYLEGAEDQLAGTLTYLASERGIHASVPEIAGGVESTKRLIYNAAKENKLGTYLPGLNIRSGIFAAVRHRRQPFKKGDREDFLHAAAALPYCDYFFTEKKLGSLISSRPLEFDKLYDCIVCWRESDVLRELQTLG